MSSVAVSPSCAPLAEPAHWDEVRRIYRRLCLLRSQGHLDEAAALESAEFARALSAARKASRTGGDEAAVLAAEAERVSTACLLAEMIAPLLAECLRAEWPSFAAARAPARTASPRVAPSSRTPSAAPPGIADLIDGMLSLEAAEPAAR